jgi:hypothetical protein
MKKLVIRRGAPVKLINASILFVMCVKGIPVANAQCQIEKLVPADGHQGAHYGVSVDVTPDP